MTIFGNLRFLPLLALPLFTACAVEPGSSVEGITADNNTEDHASDSSQSANHSVRVRRNVKDLSASERKEFVRAVLRLKTVRSPYDPSLSYYDQFVVWHRSLYHCTAANVYSMAQGHGGPLFLPWHRQFLRMFESALRDVGHRDITVPYWDWTDAESTASVFADDFMGGNGDPAHGFDVTTGPFRAGEWVLNIQPEGIPWSLSQSTSLRRRFGRFPAATTLPTTADVQAALGRPVYDVAPWNSTSDWNVSFRNALEGYRDPPGTTSHLCGPGGVITILNLAPMSLHNRVHQWTGGVLGLGPNNIPLFGTMVLTTSPNDPVFFLHHANIDRIWAAWQAAHPDQSYQPVTQFPNNNIDDVMHPFDQLGIDVTPGDMLDNAALDVSYQ